jgi:hypothetical protein
VLEATADLEMPSNPLNLIDSHSPLLRHNRPFSASVQPVGATLPVAALVAL